VLADVPGLIEGAHAGRGLGHHFLRHVERTRALVGVIDGAAADPLEEWEAVAEELRLHDPTLVERPILLVVTKLDLPDVLERWPAMRAALRDRGHRVVGISSHDGTGLDELRGALDEALAASEAAAPQEPEEMRVHRFDPEAEGFRVVAEDDALRLVGRRIEALAARTDFTNDESRERFQRVLERFGMEEALLAAGARAGTMVRIGAAELEWDEDD
jgi:GTP-binding protein